MRSPSGSLSHLKPNFAGLYRSLAVDGAIPILIIQILVHRGVPLIPALAISAIVPAGSAVVTVMRQRRLDLIAAIVLFFLGVGILTSLKTGDIHVALAKESIGTGLFGSIFLASLLGRRPLIFTFGREFATAGDPARQTEWDRLWDNAYFRYVNRLMTVVWGVTYLIEAFARVVIAYTLAPAIVAFLSPMLAIVTTLGLIAWTMAYNRHARRRGEHMRAQMQTLAPEPVL